MKNIYIIILVIIITSCKSKMDDKIKKGYFDSCKKATVEQLVNNFFNNPKWESFVSPDDDKYHLNVSGQIQYEEKPAKALIQFEELENEGWQINAFEINGEPQEDEVMIELVSEMCNAK
jgi:hypothetical protein